MNHKYKSGRRVMNWRVGVLSIGILLCAVVGSYSSKDNVYVREQDVFMKPVVVIPEQTTEDKIKEYFPKSYKTMIAIAKAESGLNNNVVNYNCWYDSKGNISTKYIKNGGKSCRVEDRKYSFGVDCFILQAHYKGSKTCPDGVTIDMHLREMAELSKSRGFQPWVSFNLKMHEKYLTQK